jgi:hypothetical protein
MSARRTRTEIDHRCRLIAVGMLTDEMVMNVIMAMVIVMVTVVMMPMMVRIVMGMVMHGSIGMAMLVAPALGSTFNGCLARGASANRTHQSTSSSLILSSSPEVTCN